MPLRFRRPSRRTFLAAGAAGSVGALAWARSSSSWYARFIRERLQEIGKDVRAARYTPTPATWNDNAITLAWLGHASVLINFYGLRILTDPVLYDRIGVDIGPTSVGPLRLTKSALTPEALPDIDLLLVSHAHFDHLDTPSLAAVRGRPAVLTASGVSDLLPAHVYSSVAELRWNEATRIQSPRGDVQVRSIEVKHWGARLRRDTWRGWTGFVVEREGKRLLIGGDTAETPLFRSAHRSLGPFEAAVMPVGAYDPWIWNHCNPEQAVAMADAAGARRLVPVHHQTFKLSSEGFREPIERVQAALAKEAGRLALQDIGETTVLV